MKYFVFIDESGSADFFGIKRRPLWLDEDFVPILMIGLIITKKRSKLRKEVELFRQEILKDPLYNEIYSIKKVGWYPHARTDHSEVRAKFFELIREMDYIDCYIVIARKNPERFIAKHNGKAKEFYFDILSKLIHQVPFEDYNTYQLYLSKLHKHTVKDFTDAVSKVFNTLQENNGKRMLSYRCNVVKASESWEMCVIDYLLWAVQRYIMKGERRFLAALEHQFKIIYDIYDDDAENNLYTADNPFNLEKASDFGDQKI